MGTQPKSPADEDVGKLKRLKRLGFDSLAGCLLSVPKGYLDFTRPARAVTEEMLGKDVYVELRVFEIRLWNKDKARVQKWSPWVRRVTLKAADARGRPLEITVFGNLCPARGEPAVGQEWRDVCVGDHIHVYGQVAMHADRLQLAKARLVAENERGQILGVYPGKAGQIKGEAIEEKVRQAWALMDRGGKILLDKAGLREDEFPRDCGFANAASLLRALHNPRDIAEGNRAAMAARRLAADAMVRRAMAGRLRPTAEKSRVAISDQSLQEAISALPFQLTADQVRAISEIVADLRSNLPMRRLISGDVGTGKSATFMVPAVCTYRAGRSVGIVAPSLLVVEQLARELRQYYPGVPVVEVTKGVKLAEGILVGTTALLNAAKKAGMLFDLFITDEQQKFSVGQKESVVGPDTNVLEATATAIPRTLALTQFGGMNQSILRQVPVVKNIHTHIISMASESDCIRRDDYFYTALERGLQVAVIYPQVASETNRDSAWDQVTPGDEGYLSVQAAAARWERMFPGQVGCLHGKMTGDEKTAVIRDMHAKKFQILISSVVIEVGVTLPSLKAMMIVNPERYGLSQIHQLRGRLARKGGNGRLFLVVDQHVEKLRAEKPEMLERLETLVECQDGFELAERDMEMRGFGDVTTRSNTQSGSARCLFWGITISGEDLMQAADRLGGKG